MHTWVEAKYYEWRRSIYICLTNMRKWRYTYFISAIKLHCINISYYLCLRGEKNYILNKYPKKRTIKILGVYPNIGINLSIVSHHAQVSQNLTNRHSWHCFCHRFRYLWAKLKQWAYLSVNKTSIWYNTYLFTGLNVCKSFLV